MKVLKWVCGFYVGLTLLAGVLLGGWLFSKFWLPAYFLVGFVPLALLGLVPGLWVLGLTRLRTWKGRLVFTLLYGLVVYFTPVAFHAYFNLYETPSDQGPYLSWTADPRTTMTVSWTTREPQVSSVEIRSATLSSFTTVTGQNGKKTHYHHVTVRDLSPDEEVTYRVPQLGSTEYAFRTAPSASEEFHFVVYGDNRYQFWFFSYHDRVVKAIKKYEPEGGFRFVVNTGDIVELPGSGYGWQWHQFLDQVQPLATTIPYMISLGNHEAKGEIEEFQNYFDFGTDDFWYSFDYAGAHLIFLSSEHPIDAKSPQYRWLIRDLQESSERTDTLFVFFHRPLFTYDPRENYRRNPRREELIPLFKEYGVDIVFCGHVHAYEHLKEDGLHLVTTGGGGVPLWNVPEVGEKTVRTETTFHFCDVTVRDGEVEVIARRTDGSEIESFTVGTHSQEAAPKQATMAPER